MHPISVPMRRLRLACLALLLVSAAALGACGEGGDDRAFAVGEATREGIAVELDDIDYEVFITRELNIRDPEDKQYYRGPPPAPGSGYFGVFLRACALEDNEGPRRTAARIRAVNIRGKEYEPVPLSPGNPFAYRSEALEPGKCLPDSASATSFGPTGGAMILFRVPFEDTEDRPFELEIEGEPPAAGKPPREARFELDL